MNTDKAELVPKCFGRQVRVSTNDE